MNIQDVTVEMIDKAYRGKESPGRSCRCGCNGNYYSLGDGVSPDGGARKGILNVLRTIQAHAAEVDPNRQSPSGELLPFEIDGQIIDLIVKTPGRKRSEVFTLYLKDGYTVEKEESNG